MNVSPTPRIHEQGFTLFEVLIALVVLSIGLLGLAGLQALAFSNNTSAYTRTQAVTQAYDLADRMRANFTGTQAGNYNTVGQLGTIPLDPGCITTGCTPSQMATYDEYVWNTENQALLPQGFGTVTALGNGVYRINVRWNGGMNASGSGQIVHSVSVDVEP